MIKQVYDFIKSKGLVLETGRVIVNKKLVYILNDQFSKYTSRRQNETFLEFIYKNASERNKDNKKVVDFFSRILNTISHLSNSVFEIKTLLLVMCSEKKNIIKRYLKIRNALIAYKGKENSLKTQTSLIDLREIEFMNLLKFFDIRIYLFKEFMEKRDLVFNKEGTSLDSLIYFFLNFENESKIDDKIGDRKQIRLFVNKNKLRRCWVKVKFVVLMNNIIKKSRNLKEIKKIEKNMKDLKKMIKNKIYFKQETKEKFSKFFLGWFTEDKFTNSEKISKNFLKIISENKKKFFYFLSKKLKSKKKNSKQIAEHIILLLHLKQHSDLKRISKEIKKLDGEENKVKILKSIKILTKDIYFYEYFKRETIEGLKTVTKEDWKVIVKKKFIKDENLDKEVITNLKRLENNLIKGIEKLVLERKKYNFDVISKIEDFHIFDEFINFVNVNILKITDRTELGALMGKNKGKDQSQLFMRSKILNKEMGKSVLEQKGIKLCGNCRGILGKENENDVVVDSNGNNVDQEGNVDEIIKSQIDANKSILNYVKKKRKQRGSGIVGKRGSRRVELKEVLEEVEERKFLPTGVVEELPAPPVFGDDGGLPAPPVFGGDDLAPPPIFGGNDLAPPPIFGGGNDLAPPPIFGGNDLAPPPIFGGGNDLAPPPIFGGGNDLAPPPIFGGGNDLAPPPIFGGGNDLAPPPVFGGGNDLAPPPVFGGDLAPPPVFGLSPPPVFGLAPPPVFGSGINTKNQFITLGGGNQQLLPPPIFGSEVPTFRKMRQTQPNAQPNPSSFTTNIVNQRQAQTKQRQNTQIAQSDGRKMKTLFWDKISDNKKITTTIWMHVFNNATSLSLNKIHEYFQDKKIVKKVDSSKNDNNKNMKVELIGDETRKKIINIALTKFFRVNKLTWESIKKLIIEIDEKNIGFDSFMSIEKLAPSSTEIEIAKKNTTTSKTDLDDPSRWICEIYKIPRFKQRFSCLNLKYEFLEDYDEYKKYLLTFFELCENLRENIPFQKFLKICLDAGNILNTGNNRRGNAYGFRIKSLKSFLSCKSSLKRNVSLAEYIIMEVLEQNPKILDFIPLFCEKFNLVMTRNIENLVKDIMKTKGKFNILRNHLEESEKNPVDNFFIDKFDTFFSDNGEKVVFLEEESLRTKEFYFETMVFLGENERELKRKQSKEIFKAYAETFWKLKKILDKVISART